MLWVLKRKGTDMKDHLNFDTAQAYLEARFDHMEVLAWEREFNVIIVKFTDGRYEYSADIWLDESGKIYGEW